MTKVVTTNKNFSKDAKRKNKKFQPATPIIINRFIENKTKITIVRILQFSPLEIGFFRPGMDRLDNPGTLIQPDEYHRECPRFVLHLDH